jgi:hypothetical protein
VNERVEAALGAVMAELDAADVIRSRPGPLCVGLHAIRGDIQKLRIAVDEALDQPGAGDSVDARMLARDPAHQ